MAIILEEKQQFNWRILITLLVIIAIIGGGAYLLFFSAVPAIEKIAPSSVARSTSELSNIQLDFSGITNDEKFRALRRYTGQPSVGQVGRANPFIKF